MAVLTSLRRGWQRASGIHPEHCFLLFALPVSLLLLSLVPFGAGMDEPSHVFRTYQLAQGNLFAEPVGQVDGYSDETGVLYGGDVDSALVQTVEENHRIFCVPAEDQRRYSFPSWSNTQSGNEQLGGGTERVTFSNTAVYSPLVYVPYIIGFKIAEALKFDINSTIVMMRICGVLLFLSAFYIAIRFVPLGKWMLLFVGLLPICLINSCCISADVVSNCCVVLFFVCFLRLINGNRPPATKDWLLLFASCCALAFVKMPYYMIVLLLLMAPLWNRALRCKKQFLRLVMVFIGSAMLFLVWYLPISSINTGAMWSEGLGYTIDPESQIAFIMQSPARFMFALVNSLINFNYFALGSYGPLDYRCDFDSSGVVSLLLLLFSVLYFSNHESLSEDIGKRGGVLIAALTGLFLLVSALIHLALYLQFNEPGTWLFNGVQTRYFISLLPFLLFPVVMISYRLQLKSAGGLLPWF